MPEEDFKFYLLQFTHKGQKRELTLPAQGEEDLRATIRCLQNAKIIGTFKSHEEILSALPERGSPREPDATRLQA